MSRLKLILLASAVAGLAACDDEAYRDPASPEPPLLEPAPMVEPAPPPAPAPPIAPEPPPEPPRSSEETVQPESDTLFY